MKKYIQWIVIIIVMILSDQIVTAQVSILGNGLSGAGDYDGWNGSQTIPLDIRTQANYRINFYTDSTFRMTIDTTKGFVGIGNYFSGNSLFSRLDVDSGDINIGRPGVTDKNGFMIGHNYVLRHRGDTTSIFVGVGAGLKNAPVNNANTFVGNDAGLKDSPPVGRSFRAWASAMDSYALLN